ncbi:hypothetical protein [Sporosarcina sp. BI001-red]|nr:hypothetical protein [Sporosarcina sp. BI001-red]
MSSVSIHKQAGRRTGILLPPKSFNKITGLVVFYPITNQKH